MSNELAQIKYMIYFKPTMVDGVLVEAEPVELEGRAFIPIEEVFKEAVSAWQNDRVLVNAGNAYATTTIRSIERVLRRPEAVQSTVPEYEPITAEQRARNKRRLEAARKKFRAKFLGSRQTDATALQRDAQHKSELIMKKYPSNQAQ